jgi:5-methyltetrahydropteroyltriglutamate--homocysteine methyltransferase
MKIPTEPIGSIPRTAELLGAITSSSVAGNMEDIIARDIKDTIRIFEETGSPVITDGEQSKPSFVTYPLQGLTNISGGGMQINFADGHSRVLPLLTKGPFRYRTYADQYIRFAQQFTDKPIKQAIISASALSLIYPPGGIKGYTHEDFIEDLINECEKDIRQCLRQNACKVQMDFTEGRLSLKLDPTGGILKQFIDLNNRVFERFTKAEQKKIGIHVCPGGDHDSTHSADIDYDTFLPILFDLNVGNFYLQLASEKNRIKVLELISKYIKPDQMIFIGVTDVNSPEIETPEVVRDRVLEASRYIPLNQLGTTDDCGFSPFCDDVSTSRETAFAKIRARVEGTRLAELLL